VTRSRAERPAAPPRGRAPSVGAAAGRPRVGGPPHVYLLLGGEDVLAEQALATLLDELVPAAERALNLDTLEAGDTPVADIIARCETLPFFGARRVVLVRRAEALRPADQDALAAYLEPAAPPSTLILAAEKLDQRRRLYGVAQRTGRVIACGPLDAQDLPAWIRVRAEQEGKTVQPEAARALVLLVGGGLRELGLEIAKLAAYVGDRREITADDVGAIASHVAEAGVFDLTDAVGRHQAGRALELLQTLIEAGEPPLRVLYLLEDQIRMLLRAQTLLDRGERAERPSEQVREVLGNRAWLFRRYRDQLRAFDRVQPAEMLAVLLEADATIKTGAMAPRLVLETLIVRLCSSGKSGPAAR